MRRTVALSTFALAAFTSQAIPVTGVAEAIAGLMNGIIQVDDLTEIQQCIQNSESLATDIEAAIADFKEGNFQGIIQGVEKVGSIITELPTDLSNCENIQGDITKLEQWATIFEHPTELAEQVAENLLEHYNTIFGDISTGLADYNKGDYFDFGDEIGTAVLTAIGTSSSTTTSEISQ